MEGGRRKKEEGRRKTPTTHQWTPSFCLKTSISECMYKHMVLNGNIFLLHYFIISPTSHIITLRPLIRATQPLPLLPVILRSSSPRPSPMWAPWVLSRNRVRSPRSRSRNFSCSSFKDIQDLSLEEQRQVDALHPSPPPSPKSPSVFHRARLTTPALRALSNRPFLPDSEHLVVIYCTSLRVVRKTYEDCRAVRSILHGFHVSIEERYLSMDSRFQDELEQMFGGKNLVLPRVFIGGKHIGGADQLKELHESGDLKRLIQGIPAAVDPSGACGPCGTLLEK